MALVPGTMGAFMFMQSRVVEHNNMVGRCILKPARPALKVPGFSSSNLKMRRLLSGFAFRFCFQFQVAPP